MSDSLKQNQNAGDHSTNVQAQKVEIHHYGLTLPDVRQICMDLFEANFYKLQSVAREMADNRAREITDRFIQELMTRNPAGLESAGDPDMQAAIFTAQRNYARFGKKDLEDLLVELLVQRSSATDLLQIVLNEAIASACKLTRKQLDLLSLALLFETFSPDPPLRYEFNTLEDFKDYLTRYIAPLLHANMADDLTFLHLRSTGCAIPEPYTNSIPALVCRQFPDCFISGFDNTFATNNGIPASLVIPSFHDSDLWQVKPIDKVSLKSNYEDSGLLTSGFRTVQEHLRKRKLEESEILRILHNIDPRFRSLPKDLPFIRLTTIGIAVGNANLRHRVGLEFDLGHWIK